MVSGIERPHFLYYRQEPIGLSTGAPYRRPESPPVIPERGSAIETEEFLRLILAGTPVCRIIVGLCAAAWAGTEFLAAMFPGGDAGDALIDLGAKENAHIWLGEPWRIFTASLLHVDVVHLLLTLSFLLFFGPLLERHLGSIRFALLYLLCGALGMLSSVALSASITVGATGAVMGVMGAIGVALCCEWWDISPGLARSLGVGLVLGVFFLSAAPATEELIMAADGLSGSGILDAAAQMGGFFSGVVLAFSLAPPRPSRGTAAAAAVAVLLGCLVAWRAGVPRPGELSRYWLYEGFKRYTAGDHPAASRLWERAHDADPSGADPCATLGSLAYEDGHMEAAMRWFEQAVAADPTRDSVLLDLSELASATGRYDKALDWLQRASRLHPRDPEIPIRRGTLLRLLGRPDEALRQFAAAAAMDDKDPDADYARGLMYADDRYHDRDHARQAFELALRKNPDHIESYLALAELDLEQDRPQAMEAHLKQAAARDVNSAAVQMARGRLLEASGRMEEARVAWRDALLRDPHSNEALLGLGEYHQERGMKSAIYFDVLLSQPMRGLDDMVAHASAALSLNRFEAAADLVTQGLQMRPDDVRLELLQAVMDEARGRTDGAEKLLTRLVSIPPGQWEWAPWFNLGLLYFRQGDPRAAACLERSQALAYGRKERWLSNGYLAMNRGKLALARNQAQGLLGFYPCHKESRLLMARVEEASGHRKEALEDLEKAAALEPWDLLTRRELQRLGVSPR